jgi:hypothetical protein
LDCGKLVHDERFPPEESEDFDEYGIGGDHHIFISRLQTALDLNTSEICIGNSLVSTQCPIDVCEMLRIQTFTDSTANAPAVGTVDCQRG